MSADTHDLNHCRAWSQAVLSKRKNRDMHCSSRHCVAQEIALHRSTATKNKALDECSQDSNNCSASSQEAQSKHKKEAQAITVSAEKQREHNVQTHRLRVEDSCCCTKQTNKCSKKKALFLHEKKHKHRETQKHTETQQKTPAKFARTARTSPS